MPEPFFDAVIVAGSPHWTDRATVEHAIATHLVPGGLIIHGGRSEADHAADHYGVAYGYDVERYLHPAALGAAGIPRRNQQMLAALLEDRGSGLRVAVLLFDDDPNVEHAQTGGPADMLRRATAAGVPYLVFRSTQVPF